MSRSNVRTSRRFSQLYTRSAWRSCCGSQTRAPSSILAALLNQKLGVGKQEFRAPSLQDWCGPLTAEFVEISVEMGVAP